MKILALDIATKTGWAHSCGVSGVFDLSIKRDESVGMRLLRFRNRLKEIYDLEGVDLIAYEKLAAAYGNRQQALVVQAGLQGTMQAWAEENGVEYVGFNPGTIKKHATGKGNAGKKQMIKAAEKKWPAMQGAIISHDHADALWILDLAEREYSE